jgi:hypothetical protein
MSHTYVVEDDDYVCILDVLQLVGDQYSGLMSQVCLDAFFEQVFPHMCVHGGQWVVQEIHVCAAVHSPADVAHEGDIS